MNEASKTNKLRGPQFARTYLHGKVLDIGAGGDTVCATARSFDVEDGDANRITDYIPAESYDVVHSSHCLEHMFNPVDALHTWWAVLKKGGYLILVVPEENLYEQGLFPLFMNDDHKASFRLGGDTSWSPLSYDVKKLCSDLPDAVVLSADIQDAGYDKRYIFPQHLTPTRKIPKRYKWPLSLIKRVPYFGENLELWYRKKLVSKGIPLDQTRFDALAQIQVIVQKAAV